MTALEMADGCPRSALSNWWIRDAAAWVGLTKVEMADGWTQVGLPAVEGRGGWTQVGVTVGKMGDGTAAGEGARGGNGEWVDGGASTGLLEGGRKISAGFT